MKSVYIKSAAVVLSFSMAGCSLLVPHTQDLSARCSERDATLFIEKETFTGEGTARVKRNKHVNIMCTKPGFKPANVESTTTFSGAGLADAVGTLIILLPGIGFLSPGAWRHQSDNVNVPMERETAIQ